MIRSEGQTESEEEGNNRMYQKGVEFRVLAHSGGQKDHLMSHSETAYAARDDDGGEIRA